MGKLKRLQDVYKFPGFTPMAEVRGVFGDPWAVVITLRRRQKKRAAGSAGVGVALSMTNGRGAFATSPVATGASTSTFRFDGSTVAGVVA
jgi:hypothetical protein